MAELNNEAARQAFLILRSRASSYALAGVLIAGASVVIATLVVCLYVYDGITLDNVIRAHRENPAIWALDAMPFLFGLWGQYASMRLAREAGSMVDSSTDELRRELVETQFTAQAKTDFFARMSHELRTPLNAIIGMSDLLANERDETHRNEHIQVIRESAAGLLTLVNDVLDFSRIEAGELELDRVSFDLHQHLNGIAALMRQQAQAKGLRLLCLIPRKAPRRVHGDPGRLRQILINLIGNAIKFTDHGEVVISLRGWDPLEPDGYRLRIEVADSGIGIKPADQKKLFDAYSRLDRNRTEGAGLGLSITRELVQAMNGMISVESEPGKGSVFRFSIDVGAPAQAGGRLAAAISLQDKSVLLADPDENACATLAGQLRALGMWVTTSPDGIAAIQEALRAADAGTPFDLLLTEMSLPFLSGEELGERMRARPETSGTCLAAMTSAGVRGDAQRLNNLGFAGYLSRPIPPEHLQALIQAILFAGTLEETERRARGMITRFDVPQTDHREAPLLVVDDSPVNRQVLIRQLENMGLRADGVDSGTAALAALRERPCSVVLADLHMPDMAGDEVILAVRDLEDYKANTPVIILTAGASEAERRRCITAGAAGLLTKPLDPGDLRHALSPLLTVPEPANMPDDETDADPTQQLTARRHDFDPDLARTFLVEAETRIEEIRKAIDGEPDTEAILRNAHALKSASHHFPGNTLGNAAEAIEASAREEDTADLVRQFEALEGAWVFLQNTLETAVSEAGPGSHSTRT